MLFKLLTEQAMNRYDLKIHLHSKLDQLLEHLECLFLLGKINPDCRKHWCNELFGFCHNVMKLKHNGKYPSKEFLQDCLINTWEDSFFDTIQSSIDAINIKENTQIDADDIDTQALYTFMREYLDWLCTNLSEYGEVRLKDVHNEIDILLDK